MGDDAATMSERTCESMSRFKAALAASRRADDNIMLRLNGTGADGAECRALFGMLRAAYSQRERDIGFCLGVLARRIEERQQRGAASFSLETQRDWVDNERAVERIIKRRSLAAFQARCPLFDLPDDLAAVLDEDR